MSESNGQGGRPSKFTDEVREKIILAVRNGNYRSVAARAAGVNRSTLRSWVARGKANPESEHGKFLATLLEAEAWAETQALTILAEAAKKGDIKAVTWWLANRHPKRWSQQREKLRELERKVAELEKHLGVPLETL